MIPFCKFHGFGNDYIVFESQHLSNVGSLSDFAIKVCNRHTGIGGDGIAVVDKFIGNQADFSCRIINPDGSEAGFSGNGTRCAVAYLHYKKLWDKNNLRLTTLSGNKLYKYIGHDQNTYWFFGELGQPKFKSEDVPFASNAKLDFVMNFPIEVEGTQLTITALNVGNPVCAVFVENFEMDWRSLGKALESHALFPKKTNVVFVKVTDKENIDIRIWERGAGETSSSGTCSVGAAIASALNKHTGRSVNVHAEGGTTEVEWREEDGEMIIKGRADLAFCGEIA